MNDTNVAHKEVEVSTVNPRHLIPIYNKTAIPNTLQENTNIPILITDTTEIYRLLAASQIHPLRNHQNKLDEDNDVAVLEIGSSTGMTSSVIWQQLQNRTHKKQRRWIGLDTGADMVQVVQEKLKKHNVNSSVDEEWASCHHIDPLLDPDTASSLVLQRLLSSRPKPSSCDRIGTTRDTTARTAQQVTVLIDIGGNREEGAVLRMVDWVIRIFQSSVIKSMNYSRLCQIIIKSESIYSTLSSYIAKKHDTLQDRSKVQSGMDWFMTRLRMALRDSLPKHPLQAPKRFLLPIALTSRIYTSDIQAFDLMRSGEQQLICRYHNYHKAGCAKRNKLIAVDDITNSNGALTTSTCPYDHDHCHVCLMPGHIARHCPLIFN